MSKILNVLRTPGAMLVALILALVAQLEHTAQVFLQVIGATGTWAMVHAYAFAAAVEVAVLLFVLAGHKRISYGFALATFATNLSYYAMHGVDLLSVQGAPAWLMSILLPAAIMGYSHTIAESPDDRAADAASAEKHAESPVTLSDTTLLVEAPPGPSCGHGEATSTIVPPAEKPAETPKRGKVLANGMTAAEIAALLGTSDANVRALHARGTLEQRIAQLPAPVRVATNGYNHSETEVQ